MPTASPILARPRLAWHGWHVALPDEWAPVKIEGDFDKGSVLLADLHAPRLAIRWQSLGRRRRFDADAWTRAAIVTEVGQKMLEHSIPFRPDVRPNDWTAGRLFLEPEPERSTRDVWVGVHAASGRCVEIVYQTTKRTRVLPDEIVRSFRGFARDDVRDWSIFDLNCRVPPDWILRRQRLNAGDLTLTFMNGRDTLIVRQLAPAALALARQPIERWIETHAKLWRKNYAGRTPVEPIRARSTPSDAIVRRYDRRRRFFFARWLMPARAIIASHDRSRDRLVIIDASSRDLAETTLQTVGVETNRD